MSPADGMADSRDIDPDFDTLRTSICEVLEAEAGADQMRRFISGEFNLCRNLWSKASELGWFALTIPEAHGGLELGFAELAILYEELGRVAAPMPLLGTMLVVEAIGVAGTSEQQRRWLPDIAAGKALASLPVQDPGRPQDVLRLTREGDTLLLSGRTGDLIDGACAKLLLLPARDETGVLHHVLVEPASDGIPVTAEAMVDQTRHLAHAQFDKTPVPADRLLAGPAEALDETLLVHASLALACDAIGGAAAIFEQTLDYLKVREQFGRPIGSFQALKHRCADHKVALEASAAVVREAVRKRAANAADGALHAAMAKFYACDVYAAIATDAVQLHGGIGFTWEHSCHVFLKRAKLDQVLFGGPNTHLDRAAKILMATP